MKRLISWLADKVIVELARKEAARTKQASAFNAAMSQATHGAIGMMTIDGPIISRDGGQSWHPLD